MKDRFAGAIHTPHDESGDARKFTLALAESCRQRGVAFKLGATIKRIDRSGDRVTGVETDQGRVQGDAYVLALGSYSPLLARPLGFTLPIYPVKGYSVTLPIADQEAATGTFRR